MTNSEKKVDSLAFTFLINVIMTYKRSSVANILVLMLTVLYFGKIILNIHIKITKVCLYIFQITI